MDLGEKNTDCGRLKKKYNCYAIMHLGIYVF
jgi:hypothetical protein